jgi:ferredoxin-thioredoxin reductase catalytic subunit
MQENQINEQTEIEIIPSAKVLEPEVIEILIPDCCKYGYEHCPHVIKKEKKKKQNIGL